MLIAWSCAARPRESRQDRKVAAVSETPRVPWERRARVGIASMPQAADDTGLHGHIYLSATQYSCLAGAFGAPQGPMHGLDLQCPLNVWASISS